MALQRAGAKPLPETVAQQSAAPTKLHDETAAPSASVAVDEDQAFDTTGADSTPTAAAGASVPVATVAASSGTGLAILDGVRNQAFALLDDQIQFGSFPTIKLDTDKFIIVDGEQVDDFLCQIIYMRKRWIYKSVSDELFYSYDQRLATNGRTIEDILKEWKADGTPLKETREYVEATVIMADTSLNGQFALLSIPPRSVGRLAGYRAQVNVMKKCDLQQIVTKVFKGPKVTTKEKKTFYPWDFKFARMADEEAAPAGEPATA
jgi:hypothetical protein